MDYALIASGVMFMITSSMVDVERDIWSKLLFRAVPFVGAITPIIAGLDGLGVI